MYVTLKQAQAEKIATTLRQLADVLAPQKVTDTPVAKPKRKRNRTPANTAPASAKTEGVKIQVVADDAAVQVQRKQAKTVQPPKLADLKPATPAN